MSLLAIFVNEQLAYEYDKDEVMDEEKMAFLDKMDADMGRGIKIEGVLIASPDLNQRARFVAMNLVRAMQQENMPVIMASCAYISDRLPAVTELRISDSESGIVMDFVEGE